MCVGADGEPLVAYVDRPAEGAPRLIVAAHHHDGELEPVATVAGNAITAFDTPALAAAGEGCLLVFSAEIKGIWKLGYLFVAADKPAGKPVYLDLEGTVNVRPSVARSGDTFCLVWESNAGLTRQVYASLLSKGKAGSPVALSPAGIPSGRPAVTGASGKKGFFVAWDAFAEENSDIYGRAYAGGKWQKVERLSNDPRIERNASVAAAPDGKVWLAWEVNDLKTAGNGHLLVNRYEQQRIAIAERSEDGLSMPVGLFGENGPQAGDKICKRPVITIDDAERLHVSFRRTATTYKGKQIKVGPFWEAEIWTLAGDKWFGPIPHGREWGWWRPAPLAVEGPATLLVTLQEGIGKSGGLSQSSASRVILEELEIPAPAEQVETTPLLMPQTDFDLSAYVAQYSLRLPRQTVTHDGEKLTLYWGDMHEHTAMSQCQRALNPPARDLFLNQRDVDQLDFTALTDHGYNHCSRSWAYTREQVRACLDPGRFISLLGIEWTSESSGHHNLIFEDTSVATVYHRDYQRKAPVALYEHISETESSDFIGIPHGLSDCGRLYRQTDWSEVHEIHQPIAEVFQARQSYEHKGCPRESGTARGRPWLSEGFYLQDAWKDEVIIGTSASPDHGGTQGRTGVWAPDLSPDSLFDAFRKRHTFGTSGAKIALYFASGKHLMGDKVARRPSDKPISFDLKVVTGSPVGKVVIFRNNEVVHEIAGQGSAMAVNWTDPEPPAVNRLWYYVRVERADEELAWSSPIWFLSPEEMKRPPTHTLARPKSVIIKERQAEQNAKKAAAFRARKGGIEVKTGFEGAADLPDGWRRKKDSITTIQLDSNERKSGKRSLLIESERGMPKYTWPGVSYSVAVPPAKGKKLEWQLSYQLKTDCDGIGAYGVIEYLDEQGKRISVVPAEKVTGKTGWQRYLLTGTVVENAKVININLHLHGGGKAWYDDVVFLLK